MDIPDRDRDITLIFCDSHLCHDQQMALPHMDLCRLLVLWMPVLHLSYRGRQDLRSLDWVVGLCCGVLGFPDFNPAEHLLHECDR